MLVFIGVQESNKANSLAIKALLLCSPLYILCLINPSLQKCIDQASFEMNIVKCSRLVFHLFCTLDKVEVGERGVKKPNLKN